MEKYNILDEIMSISCENTLFKYYAEIRKRKAAIVDSNLGLISVFDSASIKRINENCAQAESVIDLVGNINSNKTRKHSFLVKLFSFIDRARLHAIVDSCIGELFNNSKNNSIVIDKENIDETILLITYKVFDFKVISFYDFKQYWDRILKIRSGEGDIQLDNMLLDQLKEELLHSKINIGSIFFSRILDLDFIKEYNITVVDINKIVNFLIATSYLTSVNLAGNIILALHQNLICYNALREGLIPAPLFVKEVLRFYSPVQCVKRVIEDDVIIGKYKIEKGSGVLLWIGSANHDLGHLSETFGMFNSKISSFSFGVSPFQCYAIGWAMLIGTSICANIKDFSCNVFINEINIKAQLSSLFLGIPQYKIHII